MHVTPRPRTSDRPHAARGALHRALAVALVTALLAGCGVRLETPPPQEPTPDATEQVRARTVEDALDLARDAEAVAAQTPDGPVRAVLTDVAAFSTRHAEELGGVYDSGLPDPTGSPEPSPAPAATDVAGVLGALVADAATAAGDADAVADGPLARLVGSVSVARDDLADRLASAAQLARPASEPAAGATDASDAATGTDDAGSTTGDTGAALALAHDEAAWTLTVLAARSEDDERAAFLAAAATHRAASDAWAERAQVAGETSDPRRASYALPADVDEPTARETLLRSLEQAVVVAAAAVVAAAPPGERGPALAEMRSASVAATARGAAPVPFPGMPELATTPVG